MFVSDVSSAMAAAKGTRRKTRFATRGGRKALMRRVLRGERGVAGFGSCGHQPGTLGARLKLSRKGLV